MHKYEPSLTELKEIRKSLYGSDSTDENMKKIQAIEAQIKRHQRKTT